MNTLKVESLTAAAFEGYGEVIEKAGTEFISINSGNCDRYSDLVALDIDNGGKTGISLFDAKPYSSPIQLRYVERHPLGSQAFIPMTNDPFIVVVADDDNGTVQTPSVFISNGEQGICYGRNIWHGVLTPIVKRTLFTVVDYIGAGNNLEEHYFDTPYLIEF